MIHLLHGIHTAGAEGPVEALAQYLSLPYVYPDYGFILALETRRINPAVIGALLPYIGKDDILVGHSNGCAIAFQIAQKTPVQGLVLLNGALKDGLPIPAAVKFVQVYFNGGDDITEVAQFEADLPASPVDPIWGMMGHAGYKGTDSRVRNFDCGATSGLPRCWGHSDIGTPEHMAQWGPFINGRISAGILGTN